MELEKRLVELRKEKNLSQEELAEKLYVSRQTISCTVAD
jgi:transcriptional regulator with XRE-family HTH domain